MARGRPATPLGTHGEITVHELGEKRYRADTRLRLHTGQTVRVRATGTSKTGAKRALEERCAQRLGATDSEEVHTTSPLTALLTAWITQHDVSRRSKEIYQKTIDNKIAPALGQVRLNELTTPRLQQFLNTQTPAGARSARAILGSACGLGVRWGVLTHNPVRDTQLPKRKKREVRALTDVEMNAYRARLVAWCGGNGMGPARGEGLVEIMDVVRGSGARIGEVLALRWIDVDLEAGTISITGTTDEVGGRKDTPKTSSSRRVIPVASIALDALRRQWDKPYREHMPELVFPTRTGQVRTVRNTETRLRAARGDLDIKPHDFRKTVATRIEQQYGLLAASRYLGHSGTVVTEQAYLAAPAVVPDYTAALGVQKVSK